MLKHDELPQWGKKLHYCTPDELEARQSYREGKIVFWFIIFLTLLAVLSGPTCPEPSGCQYETGDRP